MGNCIAPAPILGGVLGGAVESECPMGLVQSRSFGPHAIRVSGRQDRASLLPPRTSLPANVTFRGDDVFEHGFLVSALETSKRQPPAQAMKNLRAASSRAPISECVCSSPETSESESLSSGDGDPSTILVPAQADVRVVAFSALPRAWRGCGDAGRGGSVSLGIPTARGTACAAAAHMPEASATPKCAALPLSDPRGVSNSRMHECAIPVAAVVPDAGGMGGDHVHSETCNHEVAHLGAVWLASVQGDLAALQAAFMNGGSTEELAPVSQGTVVCGSCIPRHSIPSSSFSPCPRTG